jgi:hypothetical protein
MCEFCRSGVACIRPCGHDGKSLGAVGEQYLSELRAEQIPPVKGAGSGQSKKGGFCSLDGYASFYEYEIIETARRIFEAMKKYGES